MGPLDAISMSSSLLFIIPIILYIKTGLFYHINILLGFIFTILSSEFIKRNIIGNLSIRPQGANNCNVLCNDGIQEGKPGMPSSHMASLLYITTVYYDITPVLVQKLLIVYVIFMAIARYFKKCHSVLQILAGSLYGIIIGLSVRYISA